jgi:hypothetical protein
MRYILNQKTNDIYKVKQGETQRVRHYSHAIVTSRSSTGRESGVFLLHKIEIASHIFHFYIFIGPKSSISKRILRIYIYVRIDIQQLCLFVLKITNSSE